MSNLKDVGALQRLKGKIQGRRAMVQMLDDINRIKTARGSANHVILHEREGNRPGEVRVYADRGRGWMSSKTRPWLLPLYYETLRRERGIKLAQKVRAMVFWTVAASLAATLAASILWL